MTRRLLLASVCIVLTQIPVLWLDHRAKLDVAAAERFDNAKLPYSLGNWSGVDTEVDERLVLHIGAIGNVVNRIYDNGSGRSVIAHLAKFATADVSLPHQPPLCYTNAGWTIARDQWVRGGASHPYRMMHVEREGEQAVVVYWYQLGQHVAADRADLRKVLQQLRMKGEHFPPVVKVLLQTQIITNEANAKADIEQVGSLIYDWVREGT